MGSSRGHYQITPFKKVNVFGSHSYCVDPAKIRRLMLNEKITESKHDDGIVQLRDLLNLRGPSLATSDSAVEAGKIDERLKGCGKISDSLAQTIKVYKSGNCNKQELLEIAEKDEVFQSERYKEANLQRTLDNEFWTSETWDEKKLRIHKQSKFQAELGPSWGLVGMIVKANDDVRQETFAMQLIRLCAEVWKMEGLDLRVKTYRIIATGGTTGVIECIQNCISIDALKQKRKEAGLDCSLKAWYAELSCPETKKENFVKSLAAYAVMSHLFLFKDRHNGNILLDFDGHVIHIDFGFILGIAPGNQFSLETAPFKLSWEMVELMGGKDGDLYFKFCDLFVKVRGRTKKNICLLLTFVS